MKITTIVVVALFSILHSLFCFGPVKAETATLPALEDNTAAALSITPAIFESVLSPGITTNQTFELKNSSHFPLPIKCYMRTFDASDETGGVSIPDANDAAKFSPPNWAKIKDPDFILAPGTSRTVQVDFNPPADLPPGGYYAILFAESLVPESASSLQIGGRIGSLFFLIGPGNITEKARIASFDLPKFIWSSQQSSANLRFENDGNVHLRPSGQLILTNTLTKKQTTINVDEFTVLPGKIRSENIKMPALVWPGQYRAELELSYGRDKIKLTSVSTFYYLPLSKIVVILFSMMFALSLIWHKPRRRILKAIRIVVHGER